MKLGPIGACPKKGGPFHVQHNSEKWLIFRGFFRLSQAEKSAGRQDHTTSPSASSAVRLTAPRRPSHPAPNVRDDRETPLREDAGCESGYSCFYPAVKRISENQKLVRHCGGASRIVMGLSHPLSAAIAASSAAGPVAQWLEPAAHNGLVVGSSPAGPTMLRLSGCARRATWQMSRQN